MTTSYHRLIENGFEPDEAMRLMPLCPRCTSALLRSEKDRVQQYHDREAEEFLQFLKRNSRPRQDA